MNDSDFLKLFREIAAECEEQELIDIIEDCDPDPDPFINTVVKAIYQGYLDRIRARQKQIDHFEKLWETRE